MASSAELHGVARGMQQAGGGVNPRFGPGIEVLRGAIGKSPRGLQGGVHVRQLGLHDAEFADRPCQTACARAGRAG